MPRSTRSSLRLATTGLAAVIASLGAAQAAQASTLSYTGTVLTYTASPGASNDVFFQEYNFNPETGLADVGIATQDGDPITDPPAGCFLDRRGTNTFYVCQGVSAVVANALDADDRVAATDLVNLSATIDGGDGDDNLSGGQADDVVRGGAGDDFLNDGCGGVFRGFGCQSNLPTGDDVLEGGDGRDFAFASGGRDTISLGAGDDYIASGGEGPDVIDGGAGNDGVLAGGAGDDTINGGDGDDSLRGDDGADTLNGQGGDDYLYEEDDGEADTLSGGEGLDRLEYYEENANAGTDVVSITLDGVANDGLSNVDALNNFGADVEDVLFDSDDGDVGATVVGTAGSNAITTDDGADTLTGGDGTDFLSSRGGADTINAVDGFPDRVDCGEGVDVANVDQFDTVGASCETVNRSTVRSAFSDPVTPEDAPPSISFVAPAPNTTLSTLTNTFQVNATDDRGISQVIFLSGDKQLCVVRTAPYVCAYKPTDVDLGRATIVAIAYDTAGQTATVVRNAIVPRFDTRSLSISTTPGRDATRPYRFTTTGRIGLPTGVTALRGCASGVVSVQVKVGSKTVSTRRVNISKSCTFRSTVVFRNRSRLGGGTLKFTARFLGNTYLTPEASKSITKKVGAAS